MNWNDIDNNNKTKEILSHWQKLGKFRVNHPSVGAGKHQMITKTPYVFSRMYNKEEYSDAVVIGLELPKGQKTMEVANVFKDGETIIDAYSGKEAIVKKGTVTLITEHTIVLLEKKE